MQNRREHRVGQERKRDIDIVYISILDDACLWRSIFIRFKPILMHYPVTFLAIWCASLVEDKGFPHANQLGLIIHCLVSASRFPKPRHCSSVSPRPRRILLILVAEEIPLILLLISDPASLCSLPFRSLMLSTHT